MLISCERQLAWCKLHSDRQPLRQIWNEGTEIQLQSSVRWNGATTAVNCKASSATAE